MTLRLDPEDEHWRDKCWLAAVRGGHIYARVGNTRLHRVLMGHPRGLDVDHINGDTLDNRKENLRVVPRNVNILNSAYVRSRSGYRGVSQNKRDGSWRATIAKAGIRYSLGNYSSPEAANAARLQKERELYGIQPQRAHLHVD